MAAIDESVYNLFIAPYHGRKKNAGGKTKKLDQKEDREQNKEPKKTNAAAARTNGVLGFGVGWYK